MESLQPLLLSLLVAAIALLALQSLRLARQRRLAHERQAVADEQRQIASAYRAAASREHHRQVARLERSARAVEGELDGSSLLVQAGYRVLAHQVGGSWTVHADGRSRTFDLRADYVVERRGRRYVAEVKTGQKATRLSHGATRRQLLEYWAAFDVDGVLLVDADQATITHVELDPLARLASKSKASALDGVAPGRRASAVATVSLVAFVVGLVVGAAAARFLPFTPVPAGPGCRRGACAR